MQKLYTDNLFFIHTNMTQFDNQKVQELFLKLEGAEGYEAKKEVFKEIIETVQNQSGWVQGNEENGILG